MTVETMDALMVPPADLETRMDLERLQGSWTFEEGQREFQFLVIGRHFTVRFQDGEVYAGVFDLVPDERPRTMIMWILEGPPKHVGLTVMCIYELVADSLHWCPSQPGADDPPLEFPSTTDRRFLCTILRRSDPDHG